MKTAADKWYAIAAITLPLLVSWLSAQLLSSDGKYPQVNPLAHLGTIAGVVAGVFLLSRVAFESRKTRRLAFAVYVPLVVIISFIVSVIAACANI